jgi:hypothetical protein
MESDFTLMSMEAGVILVLERWKTTGPWLSRRRSLRSSQLHSINLIPFDNEQGHGGGCGDAEHERAAQAHGQGRYGRLRQEPTGESPLDFQDGGVLTGVKQSLESMDVKPEIDRF